MSLSVVDSSLSPPIDLSSWSVQDLLRVLALAHYQRDPLVFARECVPHHFTKPSARFHDDIIRMAFRSATLPVAESESTDVKKSTLGSLGVGENTTLPYPPLNLAPNSEYSVDTTLSQQVKVALAAPRGFAKSTLLSFLLPLWSCVLKQSHFIILVSNTHDQAVKFLQAIKYEFETNKKLLQIAKDIKPNKEKWSETELEFRYQGGGCKIIAKGIEAQLRGLKFLQYRPDLIVIDDGEDDEMVRSEARRQNLQHWMDHVVLHTNPMAKIVMIGTILHEASLLNRIIRKPEAQDRRLYSDWQTRCFRAIESEGSTWTSHQTTEQLEAERAKDPLGFSQEKQNEPISAEYQPFKPEYFKEDRWYTELPKYLKISITLDPACTDKEYSDYTALCVSGWDAQQRLWVLDMQYGKFTNPSDIIDLLMDNYTKWALKNPKTNPGHEFYAVGIEKIAFQKFLIHLFKQACLIRGFHPFVKELKGDRDKTRRIWQLEPLFRENRIFLRPDLAVIQSQLMSFPRGAHDDMCLSKGTKIATQKGDISIENICVGDKVLTPLGFKEVIASGYTGMKPVHTMNGITATGNHPVFAHDKGFIPLDTLSYHDKIDTLSWTSLIRWTYRKLLNGMASPTASWGRDAITSASQQLIKDGSILKDCMWRCGKLLREKQCLQAVKLIIKMVIHSITTLATWSVYRWQSTVVCRSVSIWKQFEKTYLKFEDWLLNGIALLKGVVGIANMQKEHGLTASLSSASAFIVGNPSRLHLRMPSYVQEPVSKLTDGQAEGGISQSNALYAISHLSKTDTFQSKHAPVLAEQHSPTELVPVYNLTVKDAGCYYANGVLVSNCDALAYQMQMGNVLPQEPAEQMQDHAMTLGEYVKINENFQALRKRYPDFTGQIAAGIVRDPNWWN